jgi:hypothetical protein
MVTKCLRFIVTKVPEVCLKWLEWALDGYKVIVVCPMLAQGD